MQVIIKRLSRHYSTNWVSKTGLTNKHFKARIFANNQDSSLRQFQVEDGMEWNIEDLEEYGYDDHTSLGHHILDQVREVRRYLRLEKYELPKLAGIAFRETYVPPSSTQLLKFQHCYYLGEPEHPASAKASLTFKLSDLGLEEENQHLLRLLLGPRYEAETDLVKMSSDRYPNLQQNIKYLSDTLDRLIEAVVNSKDKFLDVPKDANSRKGRSLRRLKKLQFPEEWKRPDVKLALQQESIA